MIVGIDEVGRGCWAGPVVAGAVILDKPIAGLRDSKKLSRQQRASMDAVIRQKAKAIGLGWVSHQEVDVIGLTQAVRLAMQRALAQIDVPYQSIIIDGNYNYLATTPGSSCLVKADDSVPAVSAASIVAKVARDAYMAQASTQYPDYGFDAHVGYGTLQHRTALQQWGICPLHRTSFAPIKALMA